MNLQQQLVDAAQALNAHEFSAALSLLQPVTVAEPNSPDGWQLIALAYKGLGQSGDAEQAFLKSIEILEQPHVLTNLANLYRSTGRLKEAVEIYERALVLQSDNVPCQINLARTLLDLKQLDIAEKHFANVVQRVPEHINARIGLAQVLQLKGLQQEALGLFQSVLQSAPDNSAALNGLGISLKVLGYLDDATEVLLSAALASPEAPEIQSNLASALALSGREEEAVAAYERAIDLNPNNIEFHNWFNGYLGVIDHPDYLSSYRRVLKQTPRQCGVCCDTGQKIIAQRSR
jgi:superkiller protein 3